uniref:Uncharacterized protein n=1 Tax=Arundo donax TaxID=35708 RepID=A0A0A9GEE5_ARUDO
MTIIWDWKQLNPALAAVSSSIRHQVDGWNLGVKETHSSWKAFRSHFWLFCPSSSSSSIVADAAIKVAC